MSLMLSRGKFKVGDRDGDDVGDAESLDLGHVDYKDDRDIMAMLMTLERATRMREREAKRP